MDKRTAQICLQMKTKTSSNFALIISYYHSENALRINGIKPMPHRCKIPGILFQRRVCLKSLFFSGGKSGAEVLFKTISQYGIFSNATQSRTYPNESLQSVSMTRS